MLKTKESIFEKLRNSFDEMITLEFSYVIRAILDTHCSGLVDINLIAKFKDMSKCELKKLKCEQQKKGSPVMVGADDQSNIFMNAYTYQFNHYLLLKNKPLTATDRKSIESVLDKVVARVNLIKSFLRLLILFFLKFIDFTEDQISDCKSVVDINIMQSLFHKKSGLKGISWYLVQLLNNHLTLDQADSLIRKIQSSQICQEIDIELVKKELFRKHQRSLMMDKPTQAVISEIEESICKEYFTKNYPISYPKFEDDGVCSEYMDTFRQTKVATMKQFLIALKRFAKLLSISYSRGIFFPVYLLKLLDEWVDFNFPNVEVEFKINVIRLIAGNLEDIRVVLSLLMVQHFSPNDADNSFFQLFLNSLTLDVAN